MKIIEQGSSAEVVVGEGVSSEVPELFRPAEVDESGSVSRLLSPQAIDRLLADADGAGVAVDGPGGLIQQMIAAVLEQALDAELAEHLGYERGQAPDGALVNVQSPQWHHPQDGDHHGGVGAYQRAPRSGR